MEYFRSCADVENVILVDTDGSVSSYAYLYEYFLFSKRTLIYTENSISMYLYDRIRRHYDIDRPDSDLCPLPSSQLLTYYYHMLCA